MMHLPPSLLTLCPPSFSSMSGEGWPVVVGVRFAQVGQMHRSAFYIVTRKMVVTYQYCKRFLNSQKLSVYTGMIFATTWVKRGKQAFLKVCSKKCSIVTLGRTICMYHVLLNYNIHYFVFTLHLCISYNCTLSGDDIRKRRKLVDLLRPCFFFVT
jgi:hypothetical protein